MAQSPSEKKSANKKIANSLVAASAAGVLAVYTAGYARTRSAADQFDAQSEQRRSQGPEGRGGGRGAPEAVSRPVAAPNQPEQLASLTHPASVASPTPDTGRTPAVSTGSAPVKSSETPATVTEHKSDQPVVPSPVAVPEAPVAIASAPAVAPSVTLPPPPPAAPAQPVPAPAPPPAPKYKDGSYTGWGTSRHGDIQAEVVIENGRIVSANIAQCLTRYSCNVIGRLPPEVPQRQSAEVDYVSGATQSTNAYYYAVVEALGKAK